MLKRYSSFLAVAVALATSALVYVWCARWSGYMQEPDRYFHLGLSKIEARYGFVASLPQAEDIGWNDRFQEKEFLFHALTSTAYKLGGEPAALAVVPLICARIVLSIFFISSRWAGWGATGALSPPRPRSAFR